MAQVHSIKRRVLPSGKVAFDAERTVRGHADRFWAIALACQKERGPAPARTTEIGVRVLGQTRYNSCKKEPPGLSSKRNVTHLGDKDQDK